MLINRKQAKAWEVVVLIASFFLNLLLLAEVLLSTSLIIEMQFYLYIFLLVLDMFSLKRFSLFQVWIAGFIFMIWSEMMILAYSQSLVSSYIPSFVYLLSANNVVLAGYLFFKPHKDTKANFSYYVTKPSFFFLTIILLTVFFVGASIQSTISRFTEGAYGGEGDSMGNFNMLSTVIGGIGILLPALIAFYFRFFSKRKWLGYLWVLPILIVYAIGGVRSRLLFAIIPFIMIVGVVNFGKGSSRNMVKALCFLAILVVISSVMKKIRGGGVMENLDGMEIIENSTSEKPLYNIACNMSNEGVVQMIKYGEDYFETHNYHLGKETGYILYFWIPRSIWKEKPTMLDHWLIRKFENVPDTHSSASGFAGELKADFGWFSLFILFYIGILIGRLDNFISKQFCKENADFQNVLASIMVAYVFFAIRSPLTSTFIVILQIVIFRLMRKILTVKVYE